MEITTSLAEKTVVLELIGRLDGTTSKALEDRINAAFDTLAPALVLDFTAVDFVSSAGLRVMLTAAKRCRKENRKLALHSVPHNVVEVFRLGGLVDFFPMLSDRANALAAVRQA